MMIQDAQTLYRRDARIPWECPRCGRFSPSGSIHCDCGYNFQTGSASQVVRVRPWIRFWARGFDACMYGLLLMLVFPVFFFAIGSNLLLGWIGYLPFGLLYLCVEAFLLSRFGTTPGKW